MGTAPVRWFHSAATPGVPLAGNCADVVQMKHGDDGDVARLPAGYWAGLLYTVRDPIDTAAQNLVPSAEDGVQEVEPGRRSWRATFPPRCRSLCRTMGRRRTRLRRR